MHPILIFITTHVYTVLVAVSKIYHHTVNFI